MHIARRLLIAVLLSIIRKRATTSFPGTTGMARVQSPSTSGSARRLVLVAKRTATGRRGLNRNRVVIKLPLPTTPSVVAQAQAAVVVRRSAPWAAALPERAAPVVAAPAGAVRR